MAEMTLEQVLEAAEKLTPEERDLLVDCLVGLRARDNGASEPFAGFPEDLKADIARLSALQLRAVEQGKVELIEGEERLNSLFRVLNE